MEIYAYTIVGWDVNVYNFMTYNAEKEEEVFTYKDITSYSPEVFIEELAYKFGINHFVSGWCDSDMANYHLCLNYPGMAEIETEAMTEYLKKYKEIEQKLVKEGICDEDSFAIRSELTLE